MGKLTVAKVRALRAPGRYGDGDGLWLQVRDNGRKSWLYRFKMGGKARAHGLGRADDVGLAEARDLARECRRLVRAGVDPINRRRASLAAVRSASGRRFRNVALACVEMRQAAWRNQVHRDQWKSSLESLVYPIIGDLPVADIGTPEVMAVLKPIWTVKPETASRVRARLEAVLDYARVQGLRTGENPARWKGHLRNLLPPRAKLAKVKHHRALPFAEVAAFLADLRRQENVGGLALQFLLLTATRTREAVGARWSEIDRTRNCWVIPAERMKGFVEHTVPLSAAALDVLDAAKKYPRGPTAVDFVFPGRRGGPLSSTVLLHVLRRMGRDKTMTVHGLRSTFRDWCEERTGYSDTVKEMALAHRVGDSTKLAYMRSQLLEQRARLMADWATFVTTPQPAAANVVPIRAANA